MWRKIVKKSFSSIEYERTALEHMQLILTDTGTNNIYANVLSYTDKRLALSCML